MVVLILLAAAAAVPRQSAQPEQPELRKRDEIVVTGERQKRSLKNTPSSVFVFEKKDIDRLAAPDRLQDILQNVPNVLIQNHRDPPVIRGQQAQGVLQGLDAFFGGARPRTVLQIDGRTVSFAEFLNTPEGIWDVDHVEVFVSPQSTTQGANSIGGAIFMHTADPTFRPEARIRAIAGDYERRQVSASISAPIASDELAFRLSGDLYHSVSTTKLSGPVDGIADLNPDRYWTVRAKLLAKPHALPGLKVLAIYSHTHNQVPQVELALSPVIDRRDDSYVFGYYHVTVDTLTSRITYPVTPELESRSTVTFGSVHYHRFAPDGFGPNHIRDKDRSFESVVDWKPAGSISAVGGIAYQNYNVNQSIDLTLFGLGVDTFKDRQPSAGIFGELTWRATNRLFFTAGGRYQSDNKRRTGLVQMWPPLVLDYDATWHAFLPKLTAAYDVTDDVRFGLLLQRAYNPGGTDIDPGTHRQLEFRPEYMWDYELFTRATLFGNRVTVNGNIFYQALKDQQRTFEVDVEHPEDPLFDIINEPKAETYGAELSVAAKPIPQLTLNMAIGYLKTRIIKGVIIADPYVDKSFFGSPALTADGGVDWAPVKPLHLNLQVRHVTGFDNNDVGDKLNATKGFWMVDGRANLYARRFTVFVYAQNIFNTLRILGWAGPLSEPFLQSELTDPRELGAGLEARF